PTVKLIVFISDFFQNHSVVSILLKHAFFYSIHIVSLRSYLSVFIKYFSDSVKFSVFIVFNRHDLRRFFVVKLPNPFVLSVFVDASFAYFISFSVIKNSITTSVTFREVTSGNYLTGLSIIKRSEERRVGKGC